MNGLVGTLIKSNGRPTGRLLFWISALPLLWLAVMILYGDLGEDPEKTVSEFVGPWAVRFLLLTLAITPLAELTHQHWLIKNRRMFALYAFFYATLHLCAYLTDFQLAWSKMWADFMGERNPITVGILSFILMIPLAATSNRDAIRKFGARSWKRLHWLTYPAAGLAVYHAYLMVRYIKEETPWQEYASAIILTALLCYRLFANIPKWTPLSEADAKAHPLYGFGGWLYAFYGYLCLRLLLNLNNIFGPPIGMIGMYGDDQYTIMQFAMGIQMLCFMVFLVLAPTQHPATPKATITALCIGVAAMISGMAMLENFDPQRFGAVIIHHGLTALFYALYLTKSKRVNITYHQRIAPET